MTIKQLMKDNRLYVSDGNIKVKCTIWCLPAIKTCKKCLKCHKYCFALKSEIQYPDCRPCRERNLKASKRSTFIDVMADIVRRKKSSYFRIHESGDFYSAEYALAWYEIIERNPDTTFYAYTKRWGKHKKGEWIFSAKMLAERPKNLVLIASVDDIQTRIPAGPPKGFDKVAIVMEKGNSTCPAQKDESTLCIRHCKRCASKRCSKVIVFDKH